MQSCSDVKDGDTLHKLLRFQELIWTECNGSLMYVTYMKFYIAYAFLNLLFM
jgi:hypothetical protein